MNLSIITLYFSRYQVTPEALQKRFVETVTEWLHVRKITIEQVRETAMELVKYHHNVNISRITSSIVSTGGTAAITTGFGLAPITFRTSLVLSIVGTFLSVAGGVIAAGASIADTVLEKVIMKKIQKQVDDDNLQVKVIRQMSQDIQDEIEHTQADIQVGSAAALAMQGVPGAVQIGNVGMKVADLATFITAAFRIGGAAALSIARAKLALSIIMIPIDLVEIIRSGHSLRKGSQTESVKELNTLVVELEEQMESIKKGGNIE